MSLTLNYFQHSTLYNVADTNFHSKFVHKANYLSNYFSSANCVHVYIESLEFSSIMHVVHVINACSLDKIFTTLLCFIVEFRTS